jgi:hypothetical protein
MPAHAHPTTARACVHRRTRDRLPVVEPRSWRRQEKVRMGLADQKAGLEALGSVVAARATTDERLAVAAAKQEEEVRALMHAAERQAQAQAQAQAETAALGERVDEQHQTFTDACLKLNQSLLALHDGQEGLGAEVAACKAETAALKVVQAVVARQRQEEAAAVAEVARAAAREVALQFEQARRELAERATGLERAGERRSKEAGDEVRARPARARARRDGGWP